MNSNYKLNPIRDNAALAQRAAEWFNAKWGVPVEAYLDSMNECIAKPGSEVQWYVLTDEDRIIAGMGVIENDFHDRKDLAPNICAVYTEEEYRGRGIAKYLLDYVCADLSRLGTDTLYLITNHDDLYEKCGFEHYCNVKEDSGNTAKMYRRISRCGESMGALNSFLDGEGRLTALPAKRKMKLHALVYLSEKFISTKVYTEPEVNALLNEWHTYGDPVTLRRELCDHKILSRDPYGREYRRAEVLPSLSQLEAIYG